MGRSADFPDREVEAERIESLFHSYREDVRSFLWRCGVSNGDLDDMVADVFVVAWRRINAVPPAPGDRAWLLGVARNTLAKGRHLQFRRRRLDAKLRATSVEGGALDAPDSMQLRAAVQRLPAKERTALILVVWQGLTHEEAASAMKCSPKASRMRLHRAKMLLRNEFATTDSPTQGRAISVIEED